MAQNRVKACQRDLQRHREKQAAEEARAARLEQEAARYDEQARRASSPLSIKSKLDSAGRKRAELVQLESEMKKVEAALERYFDAFEAGSLTPAICKQRVDELVARRSVLEQRKAEVEAPAAEGPAPPTDADLAELAGQTASIIRKGDRRQVKALLQALVQRIDVESRAHIQPVFFVPAVRAPDGSVPPA
jgi:site-specific DNA recombinase